MKHLLTLIALLVTSLAYGQESCPNMHDSNGNGTIDIEDFLSVLGIFGDVDVDEDGIWDSQDNCPDLTACNYSDEENESCLYEDSVGVCGGSCESDSDGDGLCDTHNCGTSFAYQGYDYQTVQIGSQCWFAENLRNVAYANGDEIPSSLSDEEWLYTNSGAVAVYGEGTSDCTNESPLGDACDESWSIGEYGRLYNWFAVDDERGLCPSGWNIPSDGDWMTMEIALGMSEGEANGYDWRGLDQGTQMKTDIGWYDEGNGSNSSGFSALPSGRRHGSVPINYQSAGKSALFWTSSHVASNTAMDRYLRHDKNSVGRGTSYKASGLAVRCIQDIGCTNVTAQNFNPIAAIPCDSCCTYCPEGTYRVAIELFDDGGDGLNFSFFWVLNNEVGDVWSGSTVTGISFDEGVYQSLCLAPGCYSVYHEINEPEDGNSLTITDVFGTELVPGLQMGSNATFDFMESGSCD